MTDAALFDALPGAAVARALLPYLRQHTGVPALELAAAPAQMLGGFDSLIYGFELSGAPPAFGGPLVLRVYRDAQGPERAQREGCVQNAVAALGYPTPRVLLICPNRDVLGGAFLIMQRLAGRVMLDAFFSPRLLRLPAQLAALHARLHGLDPRAFERQLAAAGCPTERLSVASDLTIFGERIGAAALSGLEPGLDWLLTNRPAGARAVCHGDFHPLNILLRGGEVTGVLDWAWAKIDDPAWDVGATVALLTRAPAPVPSVLRAVAAAGRRWFVDRYLRAYAALRTLDLAAVRYYEALRCLVILVEAGEHIQAQRGVIPPIAKPTAFTADRIIEATAARFTAISHVTVKTLRGAPV